MARFIVPIVATYTALAVAGCASGGSEISVAEQLYVIDHSGAEPSDAELARYNAVLERAARDCGAPPKAVANYAVAAADKIKADTGKEFTLFGILNGFPRSLGTSFKCAEKFAIYAVALEGG